MSDIFRELLIKSFSPETTDAERQQVTEQLLAMYENPESSINILQFLLNEPNPILRRSGSISISKSLKKNWKKAISKSEFREPVKDAIINLYRKETDQQNRHLIVQASKPVFHTDACNWPQLFEFVTFISSDKSNLLSIEFALYLITCFSSSLQEALLQANLPFFLDLIAFSFGTANPDLIDTACGLVAVLINQIDLPEEMEMMAPWFTQMIDAYSLSLTGDINLATRIANKVSWSFGRKDYPIPNGIILEKLFSVVPSNPIIAFGPIHQFVKICGKDLSGSFENIIRQTLTVASNLFIDGTLEDNENSTYVLHTIELMSKTMKPRIFFPKFLGMISTDNLPNTISSAISLSLVIPMCKEAVTKHISQLSTFILNVLNMDHICAKEVALDIIKEIATLFEEGKSDIASQFIPPLIDLLSFNQPILLKHTLMTLRKLLRCTDIDVNNIGPMLQSLSNLLQQENSQFQASYILDVISALVFSAGEDVGPFVQTLFPLIVQTASIPEESDPNLKANSIEALSNILRFSNLSDELINQALQLIVTSGQTNDYDIRTSVMISLSNILVIQLPQIAAFAEQIQQLVFVYLSEDIQGEDGNQDGFFDDGGDDDGDEGDDEDEEIEQMFSQCLNQVNSIADTLLLIKNIYKLCPQISPADPTEWFNFSVNFMESFNDDLINDATLASLYMLLKVSNLLDPSGFYEKLHNNFNDCSSATVISTSFKAIRRFLENNYELPKEMIDLAISKGIQALHGKLDCQDYEDDISSDSRLTLSMQVNSFFAALATKIPQAFPINEYIDYQSHICKGISEDMEDSDEFEISQCIGVLRQLYISSSSEGQPNDGNPHLHFTSLQKKFIIKAFFNSLPICDFSVLPEPLIALKNVLIRESNEILPFLDKILEFISNLFDCENGGQMHFWSTITNAVSFLCSLMKINMQAFDLPNWLPKILTALPVKGDEMEAENIYSTLIWLITQTPAGTSIIGTFGPILIRIFAQTLGLKDAIINSFKLPPTTYQGIVNLLANLLGQIENSSEILNQSFTDDLSKSRCQQRLQKIQ